MCSAPVTPVQGGDGHKRNHIRRPVSSWDSAQRQSTSRVANNRFSTLSSEKGTAFSRPSPTEETGIHDANYGGERNRQTPQANVAAVVLEESVGDVTFFWNLESDVGKLYLQPASISTILRERRAKIGISGLQEPSVERVRTSFGHTSLGNHCFASLPTTFWRRTGGVIICVCSVQAVVGFIAQDVLDQRAVAASSVPIVEPKPIAAHSIWESIGQSLGFGDFATGDAEASSNFSSPSTCQSHWLGDGICDELCDTAV